MAVAARKQGLEDTIAGRLRALQVASRVRAGAAISFSEFLTSPDYAGLKLSPAMTAIADAVDGCPVTTISTETSRKIFACDLWELPEARARVVGLSAGGRGGKTSRGLAPAAVHAAFTTPLRAPGAPADPRWPLAQELGKGERPGALIVAPKKRLAKQAFSFVKGIVKASPVLRRALVGEPTGESLILRRPDGIEVEILVVVADKGGASARSKTLVFVGLDEASFFQGEGYAVNDEDVFSAAIQRVVPYGQAWVVSTPWIEGEGLLERLIETEWGKHRDGTLVAARVGTRTLNPNWDPDGSIERRERARPGGNENADREILATPLPRGTRSFFDHAQIAAALSRRAPIATPEEHGAGCDYGHAAERDNSAYAATARYPGGVFAALEVLEIASTSEQKPSSTYRAFAQRMFARRITQFAADVFHKASVREVMDEYGISFVDVTSKDKQYSGAKDVINEGRFCMGDLPEEERERLAEQLRSIVARPKQSGGFTIDAPRRRASDMLLGQSTGGHADSVSALVAGLWLCGSTEPGSWGLRPEEPLVADEPDDPYARGVDGDDLRWRE